MFVAIEHPSYDIDPCVIDAPAFIERRSYLLSLPREPNTGHRHEMTYTVTITPTDGDAATFPCGGLTDQEAMIYAGKVVEQNANPTQSEASVTIKNDGREIGVPATVRDMLHRSI